MAKPIGARNKKTITREAIIKEQIVAAQAAGSGGFKDMTTKEIGKLSLMELMVYAAYHAAAQGNIKEMTEIVSRIMPYRYAKLSQVTTDTTIRRSISELSDDELAALASNGEGDSGDSEEDEDSD